jgi:predicted ATP-binding protein involved in virulence
MLIRRLTLTNFRAYTHAEFEFKQGLNLLVGINGVGKTTVLDALRVCLSVIFPNITETKHRKESFKESDIKIGADYLQISCDFTYLSTDYNLLIVKRKQSYVINETHNIREQTTETPDQEVFTPQIKLTTKKVSELAQDPIGVFYSTKRSLITGKVPSKAAAQGGQAAAHAEALSGDREFNLRLFAEWYKVQEKLAEEQPQILQYNAALRSAVETFLPNFSNLYIVDIDETPQFFIEKNGVPLSILQLSDGERGVLSMVLDIAKRLSQANPVLANPLQDGNGIVLIDELDLHLHPKWQRSIVNNLARTFPNCQIIATTHSPQIIGEVKPEFITIIDNEIFKPASSYGIDSSRVLEEVLDTPARNKEVDTLLELMYKSIDDEKLEAAKEQIAKLIVILGPNDPEITRSTTMIDFLEDDLSDEANK